MRFSSRRNKATSRSQGRFDAARTKTCSLANSDQSKERSLDVIEKVWKLFCSAWHECTNLPVASPSIWIKSSVFIRREPSCSIPSLPPRWLMMASISSKNIVLGAWYLANSNRTLTSFSESPRNFETIEDPDILKNVVQLWLATAFASSVFPVP
jgi:hypothetical protein